MQTVTRVTPSTSTLASISSGISLVLVRLMLTLPHSHLHTHTLTQTDRQPQTERQTYKQTERQTDRQTDTHTHRQTDRSDRIVRVGRRTLRRWTTTYIHTHTHTHIHTHREALDNSWSDVAQLIVERISCFDPSLPLLDAALYECIEKRWLGCLRALLLRGILLYLYMCVHT